ncbi:hypothetical protein IHE44_0014637, partial [Lamprotornis superbus]
MPRVLLQDCVTLGGSGRVEDAEQSPVLREELQGTACPLLPPSMASSMKNLLSELERYTQSFRVFLERSTEHQSMQEFVEKQLPDIIASIGNGKSTINVLSVGSGAGEMDLQILSKIQARYPRVTINNDVIEPSASQISKYKEHVAQASNLENIKFTWHKETADEYESRMNAEKKTKKWDFIHMIQMLYYVKDIPATLRYFHSLLESQAKLLIILVSGKSGWETLWRKYSSSFPLEGFCSFISSADLPRMLDSAGMKYQLYELPSHLDITSCFIEGDKDGERLLDFLTETIDFTKTAPPELKRQVMEELRKPGCSEIRDGKVFFNSSLGVIALCQPGEVGSDSCASLSPTRWGDFYQRFKRETLDESASCASLVMKENKLSTFKSDLKIATRREDSEKSLK